MMFQIHARYIDDRPDSGGWQSSGKELPTFYVNAANAEHAAALGHDIAGTDRW